MTKTFKLGSWLIATALFAMPYTLFAQAPDGEQSDTCDAEQSDTCVATDVAQEVVEHAVGLPTSVQSAVTMGLEKATGRPFSVDSAIEAAAKAAGMSDAAAAALSDAAGGFAAATFDSTSIATDEEEGSPYQMEQQAQQAQEAEAARQFYLSHQADLEQHYRQWLYNPKLPPAGPQDRAVYRILQ